MSGDLTIARVDVDILGNPPNVEPRPKANILDITVVDDPRQFASNSQGASDNMEYAQDSSGNWAVAFPARKVTQRANFVDGGSATTPSVQNSITWKATDSLPGTIRDKFLGTEGKAQILKPPTGGDYETTYTGPRWRNVYLGNEVPGGDDSDIAGGAATPASTPSAASTFSKYSSGLQQSQIAPGIWWGLETKVSFEKGQGFWLDIQRSGEKPSKGQPTWLYVVLKGTAGLGIWMMNNKRPKVINWTETPSSQEDMSTVGVLASGSSVRLGFLPLCGRLIINFNGADYIYTKKSNSQQANAAQPSNNQPPESFDFEYFDFEYTDIAVFGSNCQALVSLSDMTFTKGVLKTPGIGGLSATGQATETFSGDIFTISGANSDTYGGSDEDHGGAGKLTPVWDDSRDGNNKSLSIHCAPKSNGLVPSAVCRCQAIEGDGMNGSIKSRSNSSASKIRGGVSIRSSSKGKKSIKGPGGLGVLALSMTFSAPDNYHSKQTAEVTIYNPNGVHDSLLEKSQGISISAGWGSAKRLFTGVTLGGYRSETAGLETLVINCEDYMFILDSCMMINSPYYDGKYAFDAVYHLAGMAGIKPKDDSEGQPYALPQGYSFARPVYRFSKGRTIKDCILDIVKQTECTIYFDEDGIMHYTDIQGGIAFSGGSSSGTSLDAKTSGEDMILDELRTEVKIGVAVNCVSVATVDRTSGNPVFITRYAEADDLFGFLKQGFNNQSAYGSWQAANSWLDMITQRVFKAPKACTAKTASDNAITPMTIITINGQKYRVTSLQRSYQASENSLLTTVSGEWYG